MPVSNREAYALKQRGRSIPVECAECGDLVWTHDAMYLEIEDEWYCESCNEDVMDEVMDP